MSKSKMKAAFAVVALGAASAFLAPASAQYTGPSEKVSAASVADVLEKSKDDDKVMLTGMLVRKVSDEKYMFSDGTGEVQVEIDDKIFPKAPVNETTKVRINGEVDKGFAGKVEVDAKSVQILQ
ncbi:YgiW/YdeI family stress tolerance OB fold protein [Pollutimonas bauzanensis]|uniref:TIGR00156 family protein n=1 Tax=Pollutimonas bauzanensis TaxID=658167 RepID=A0A1M5MWC1_9BURK|nr:NirD/YgiW/YdeI family stress tolerance protein [Pollutimonas bauzanensis]SHG81422.1 TIGR00156 family protein [Pollutimonas bauzanensis]